MRPDFRTPTANHTSSPEHVRFREGLVGGDRDRRAFLSLGQDLEEQFGAAPVELQIAQFVDEQQEGGDYQWSEACDDQEEVCFDEDEASEAEQRSGPRVCQGETLCAGVRRLSERLAQFAQGEWPCL